MSNKQRPYQVSYTEETFNLYPYIYIYIYCYRSFILLAYEIRFKKFWKLTEGILAIQLFKAIF